jgi:hypothetical protein
MSVYGQSVCKLTVLGSQARKNRAKQHQVFKVTTAVKIKFTLLLLLTPVQFGAEVPTFGHIFSLHLQDILQKVAVLFA